MTNLTSTTLQYLNYCGGFNDSPTIQTSYYVISTPHVFRQYAFILGVTGTVGGSAERGYLENTYAAGVLSVPPFLDTCTGARKVHPEFIVTTVATTHREQIQRVAQLALSKSEIVPVLIITKSPDEAKLFKQELMSRPNVQPERVQLLAENEDGISLKDKWTGIINRATQPVPKSMPQLWRVTVTDYFGGRGHDYKVRDENVNDCGGLLVIITHIPDSRREWVQWVGRTARQDNNGQLALILDASDDFLKGQSGIVESFQQGDFNATEMVRRLLDERNKAKQEALAKAADKQKMGMVIAALCDEFYFRKGEPKPWPSTPDKMRLRDILEQHGCEPPLSVSRDFARSLGLTLKYADVN